MRRGTRVGEAYVALTADGSGLNDDIIDEMDDVGDGMDRAGRDHGDRYSDEFGDRLEDRLGPMFDRLGDELGKRLNERVGRGLRGSLNSTQPNSVMGRLGENLSERIEANLAGIEDRIVSEVSGNLGGGGNGGGNGGGGGGGGRGGGGSAMFPEQGPDPDRDKAVYEMAQRMNEKFDRERTVLLARAARADEDFHRARGLMVERAMRMDEERDRQRGLMVERAMRMDDDIRKRQIRNVVDAYDESVRERLRTSRLFIDLDETRRLAMEGLQQQATGDEAFDRQRRAQMERTLKLTEDHNRRLGRELDVAYRDNERFDRTRGRMLDMAHRMNDDFDKRRGLELDRAYQMNEDYDRSRGRMLDMAHRMNLDFDRRRQDELQRQGRMHDAALRMNADFDNGRRGGDGRVVPGNGGNGNNGRGIGDRIGSMFGAGSRNNFLNIIGKSITSLINLQQRFAGSITKLTGIGGEGASMFSKFAVNIAAMGPSLIVVALLASILVSVLSGLLGIIVALSATIVSGLTGALAVLGGALGAVAVAGGLLAVAFTSMTDAQKSMLSDAFRPLKAELTGLGQLMITEMIPYFETWSTNLQRALALAAPVASVMGQAFGRAGAIITNAFSGPGFQMLMQALAVYLPNIVTNLSTAFGQFLNGVAGVFAALLPYVEKFSLYLVDVTNRFAAWAASAEGQNSIADFMDRALVSLSSLWDFATSFFGWLADILFNADAQMAGNTMFDGLTRAFDGFRENIADGSLEQWFADATNFASDLADAVSGVADVFQSLNNSKVLAATGDFLVGVGNAASWLADVLEPLIDAIGWVMENLIGGIMKYVDEFNKGFNIIADGISWGMEKLGLKADDTFSNIISKAMETQRQLNAMNPSEFAITAAGGLAIPGLMPDPGTKGGTTGGGSPDYLENQAASLIGIGTQALNNTSVKNGGYKPDEKKPDYVNPYTEWANSLISQGDTIAVKIRAAMREINKKVTDALREASSAGSIAEVRTGLSGAIDALKTQGTSLVDEAQSALNSAATRLANSTSESETKKALAAVTRAQKDLAAAQAAQVRLNNAAGNLAGQGRVRKSAVDYLLAGGKTNNATLAEYAAARARVTVRLDAANKKLADAIAMRAQYRTQVADAVKTFGSLMTAQAKTVDGVVQALTAQDITSNLESRLYQIRLFQTNLRKLLALGLSDAAYKQLVDAGVEQGGAYATALLSGGQGAVSQVNSLTGQIDATAEKLGKTVSGRLYDAGVQAAQGLVDGLESLSAQLDSAATRLGNSIAAAVKKSLGIKSPSRVMRDTMSYVGDGLALGLDDQAAQVERAANRLSSKISIAPSAEVARYAATQSGVSGNPVNDIDVTIVTPTKDPVAAAHEAVNELVGRL